MQQIDVELSHVWMVRQFIKHSEEAEEDEELADVHRLLYDYMLAVGEAWQQQDAEQYLKAARKKFPKLRQTAEQFTKLQPEVSTHTNFQMAARSLNAAVAEIERILTGAET